MRTATLSPRNDAQREVSPYPSHHGAPTLQLTWRDTQIQRPWVCSSRDSKPHTRKSDLETTSFTVIYVTLTVTDARQPTLKARQGLKGDQRKPERVPGALSTPHQLAHLQGQGAHPLRGSLNVRKCFLSLSQCHAHPWV